jgi:hypothetical protein
MLKDIKWFTLVELLVVLTIVIILLAFWFSKLSNFSTSEATLSNIEGIKRNILNFKILSNLNDWQDELYFNRSFPLYYFEYYNRFNKTNSFYISSGSFLDNKLKFNISSFDILSSSWFLIIDDSKDVIEKDIYFNSSGTVNNTFEFDISKINNISIYVKNNTGKIITWNIKIYKNSIDDKLSINSIVGDDFYNSQSNFNIVKIISKKGSKNEIYGFNSLWEKRQLKKVYISYLDFYNNKWSLDFN